MGGSKRGEPVVCMKNKLRTKCNTLIVTVTTQGVLFLWSTLRTYSLANGDPLWVVSAVAKILLY